MDRRARGLRGLATRAGPRERKVAMRERTRSATWALQLVECLYVQYLKRAHPGMYTLGCSHQMLRMSVDGRPQEQEIQPEPFCSLACEKTYAETPLGLEHTRLTYLSAAREKTRRSADANPFDHPRLWLSPSTETSMTISFRYGISLAPTLALGRQASSGRPK